VDAALAYDKLAQTFDKPLNFPTELNVPKVAATARLVPLKRSATKPVRVHVFACAVERRALLTPLLSSTQRVAPCDLESIEVRCAAGCPCVPTL
jgi:hypothetical protein